MGILPDQPGGTSLDFDLLGDLFGITADGSIPGLIDRTQPAVEATLKQREISESPGWLGANDAAYGGLLPGVALIPNLLMNIATTIIGLPFGTWPGDGPLGFIGEIPNIFADIGNFFTNITGIFGGGVDFNDLLFNPVEAVFNFVETMIVPTDLLASLIGGFIPGLQIPGLDASKIISGTFSMEMILGLPEALAELVVGGAGEVIDIFVNTFLGGSGSGFGAEDLVQAITSIPSMFLAGPLGPGMASHMGAGILSNEQPEFLTNPTFDAPSSIKGQGMWTWDGTTGPAGLNTSVFTDAEGILKELFSNAIPVSPGQELEISGYEKHSTFTGPANSIALTIRKFNASGTYIGDDTLASIAAPSGTTAWPGSPNLTGTYTIASGVKSVILRPIVKDTATAGRVWFGNFSVKPVATNILAQLIPGLDASKIITGEFPFSMTGVQELIDTVFESISGFAETGALLTSLFDLLRNIPFGNILGIGGPGDIGGSVQSTWDQWIGGLVGEVGTGSGLADLFNISSIVSSWAAKGRDSFDILGIRNNRSLNTGFLPTTESTISLDRVALQSTAPTVPVTQSTALTGYQRVSQAEDRAVVSWQGYGITNVTHCFIAIYKMDTTTGQNLLVHESTNQVGLLSAGGGVPQPVVYSLPSAIHVEPGEVYGIEIAVRGAGTHNVVGSSTWIQDQTVYPRRYSSVRNSGTSPAPTTAWTPTYSSNVPFIEFGVSASPVAIPHSPETITKTTVGSDSIPIPDWVNIIEVVAVGSGGGGRHGGIYGVSGEGGRQSSWATGTWLRGTHFGSGQSITRTVGAPGTGGSGDGDNGAACGASITGYSVSAAGGEGGNSDGYLGSTSDGLGPGNIEYGSPSIPYVGGATQGSTGKNGAAPGGSGSGGNSFGLISESGGNGAPGAVWLRLKQS